MWLAALLAASLAITARSAAAETVAVGALKPVSSGPVFIAADRGYFAAEGLEARLKFFDAAQPAALATVAGDVGVGVTGLTAGFFNLADKGALEIIAAQSRKEPGHHRIAYLAGDQAFAGGLRALADLPGHSVALTQIGSTFHHSLGRDAVAIGRHLRGTEDDRRAPHAAREVPSRLQKGAPAVYDGILKKPADPAASAEAAGDLAIFAKHTGQAVEQLRLGIPYIDPEGRLLVPESYHQVTLYQAQGQVDKSVDAGTILDLSFIKGHFE